MYEYFFRRLRQIAASVFETSLFGGKYKTPRRTENRFGEVFSFEKKIQFSGAPNSLLFGPRNGRKYVSFEKFRGKCLRSFRRIYSEHVGHVCVNGFG